MTGTSPALPRRALLGAVALSSGIAPVRAQDDEAGSDERPRKGDLLVFSEGGHAGQVIAPGDLPLGGPPALAWPMDPVSKVVRKGSRLNQVLVVRLDDAALDDDTRPRAVDGVLAYSAICTHAGCVVTGWIEDAGKTVFKCFCHNSEYDPQQGATVVFGPAPRHLAALPLMMADQALAASSSFVGKVGPQQG